MLLFTFKTKLSSFTSFAAALLPPSTFSSAPTADLSPLLILPPFFAPPSGSEVLLEVSGVLAECQLHCVQSVLQVFLCAQQEAQQVEGVQVVPVEGQRHLQGLHGSRNLPHKKRPQRFILCVVAFFFFKFVVFNCLAPFFRIRTKKKKDISFDHII